MEPSGPAGAAPPVQLQADEGSQLAHERAADSVGPCVSSPVNDSVLSQTNSLYDSGIISVLIGSESTPTGRPQMSTESQALAVKSPFEMGCLTAIAVNAIVLMVETDHRPDDRAFNPGWFAVDTFFTVLFAAELVVRLLLGQNRRSWWMLFDGFLVVVSMLDVFVLSMLKVEGANLRVLSLLRIMRMVRILRILRLFRFAKQLVLLVHAVWGALRAMFWAMVLLILVLYILGMLVTRLTRADNELHDDIEIERWFGTLPRSLFTLFQLMTLEGWPEIARHTIDRSAWLTIFCVGFILLTNITLLNTVAGVLTENVLSTSRKDEEAQQEARSRELEEDLANVGELFTEQDFDGRLSLEELRRGREGDVPVMQRFLELAGFSYNEAEELFHIVDHENEGAVPREAFVQAVRLARGTISAKHVLGIRCDLHRLQNALDKTARLLEHVVRDVAALEPGGGGPGYDGSARRGSAAGCACGGPSDVEELREGIAQIRQDFRECFRAIERRLPDTADTASPRAER